MSENELDASNFLFNNQVYTREFESILEKITTCYQFLRKDNIKVPLNDENGIRDILVNDYINNTEIKKSIDLNYFVLPEVPESSSTGRTDIRIFSPNSFLNQKEYYIIECKRLDNNARRGVSGLNYKYIENGIQRFTTNFYSSYYKTNAMIGFVVEAFNIEDNIDDLNFLLENNFKHIETLAFITKESFIKNFDYHYHSNHKTKNGYNLKLYHLMFDFS
jgi:hypothetical protein